MKVICFDLMPYGEELDHLKKQGEKELPWPLPQEALQARGRRAHL